jgi:FkbM family methyltransferase
MRYADACTLVGGEHEIFFDRAYAFKTTRRQPVIIDCGANIGLASIWFATAFPECRVWAYEADPDICKILESNIRDLGFSDRVSVHNKAIWCDAKGVEFEQEGGFSGQVTGHSHELVKKRTLVPSATLGDILSGMEHVDLLKIDIEGAEHQALTSDIDLSNVERVFLEYHSHQCDPQKLDQILHFFSSKGFRYHIKEAFPSRYPFERIETLVGMDLQLNIYAYR